MVGKEFGGALIGTAQPLIVTVDNGASQTRVAVGKEHITSSAIMVFDTVSDLNLHTVDVAQAITYVTKNQRPDIVGYGIAGEVADNGLTIVKAGKLNDYGWVGQPITEQVAAEVGVDNDKVLLINDLVTAGLAEREVARRAVTQSASMNVRLPENYAGAIMAISTGTNTAIYNADGAINTESGHWTTSGRAEHACGCGQYDDAEAWISGSAIKKQFGMGGEAIPRNDPRWDIYRRDLGEVLIDQMVELESRANDMGQSLEKLSLFGSVALGNSGAVEYLQTVLFIPVTAATYGDDSGLYGGYFAGKEKLALAG